MNTISFPNFLNNNNVMVLNNSRECTLQNIKLVLSCEKGEFRFDPFFGVRLKRYWYEQNNEILRDILINEIYEQLTIFIPQIIIKRSDIKLYSNRQSIIAQITCRYQEDFELDTYTLTLYENKA